MLSWCRYLGKRYCGCTVACYLNVALCLQVQVLLRLYTSLLPHLRHAALQARPSWAGEPSLSRDSTSDGAHDALHATIKREAAAVLNIGHTLHSEGMQQINSPVLCPILSTGSC